MTRKPKRMTEFEPGHGFGADDWDAVSDNPEWTEEDFREARPFAEMFPELADSLRHAQGRPSSEDPTQTVTLRLDREVIEKFKAGGPGWESRINRELRKAIGLG